MTVERMSVRGFIALCLLTFIGWAACATAQQQGGGVPPMVSSLPGMAYYVSYLSGAYKLHWKYDASSLRLSVALEVQTTGWVALGLAEATSGSMAGADMLVASIDDTSKAVTVRDYYATGKVTPTLDAVQDWTAGAGSTQTQTTTTIYASRQVNTTDTMQDRPIFPGSNRIVIAFGATDAFSGHSPANRMMSAVTFYGADAFVYNTLVGQSPTQTLNFSMSYVIPSPQMTTYAFQSFTLPDTVAHVVAINFIVSAASSSMVHHLVLHDCSNSTFFQATASATGNPYPDSPAFRGAFGTGSLSNAQSLVGSRACQAPIWAWAHGGDSLVTPASAGIRIGANHLKYLIAEVHYNNPLSTQGVTDTSVIQLVYTTTMRAHDVGMLTVGDPATRFPNIPANTASKAYEAVCSSACTSLTGAGQWPTSGINVFNSFLHMHEYGTKMWNTQMRAGKVLGVRGKVEYWDFNNQIAAQSCYTVLPGDQINTHCVYSTKNSAAVPFGLSSSEEMCMAFLMYFPKMSAITQCGYFGANGIKLDMCGRAGSLVIFSNSQEAQFFDGTSEATCFGGSAQCAPAMLDSYSMCTGNWSSKVDPVSPPKTSGALRSMFAMWSGAFACALLAAAAWAF